MVEINVFYKHPWHERLWLKSLRIMPNVSFFCHARRLAGQTRLITYSGIEVADSTFYLTQSQYTDTGPTSPSADPITPSAWQGSHWSANFEVTGIMTRPGKIPSQAGFDLQTLRFQGDALTTWPRRRLATDENNRVVLHVARRQDASMRAL